MEIKNNLTVKGFLIFRDTFQEAPMSALPEVVSRGEALFNSGRVLSLAIEGSRRDFLVIGKVQSSVSTDSYRTTLEYYGRHRSVDFSCTCPAFELYGSECKHIVATHMAILRNLLAGGIQWSPTSSASENTLPPSTISGSISSELEKWLYLLAEHVPQGDSTAKRCPTHKVILLLRFSGMSANIPVAEGQLEYALLSLDAGHVPSQYELHKYAPRYLGLPFRMYEYVRLDSESRGPGQSKAKLILSDEDDELWSHIEGFSPYSARGNIPLSIFVSFLKQQKLFSSHDRGLSLLEFGEPLEGEVYLKRMKSGVAAPRMRLRGQSASLGLRVFTFGRRYFYFNKELNRLGEVTFSHPVSLIRAFMCSPEISPEQVERVAHRIHQLFPGEGSLISEIPTDFIRGNNPQPVLTIKASPYFPDTHMPGFRGASKRFANLPISVIELSFDYDGYSVTWGPRLREVVQIRKDSNSSTVQLQRDKFREEAFLHALRQRGFDVVTKCENLKWKASQECSNCFWFVDFIWDRAARWAEFVDRDIPYFEGLGWKIHLDDSFPFLLAEEPPWYLNLSPDGSDWMDFQVGVEIDGKRYSLLPILSAVVRSLKRRPVGSADSEIMFEQEGEHYIVPIADRRVLIEKKRLNEILSYLLDLDLKERSEDSIKLPVLRAKQILDITRDGDISWSAPPQLQGFLEAREKCLSRVKKLGSPKTLLATLRNYQLDGLHWLLVLRELGCGGILADDMGLGKTIQVLAYLLLCKKRRELERPALIVCPSSVASNWREEALRFAPSLKLCLLTGPFRKEKFDQLTKYDVIVSTYPLLRRDRTVLRQHRFCMAIFDEAQYLKNPDAETTKIASHLCADQILHLTGTPMENNLQELWSLFNVLAPGFLGSREVFSRWYDKPIQIGDSEALNQLQKKIKPFILRRTKTEVLDELPEQSQIAVRLDMTKRQRDFYETVRVSIEKEMRKLINEKGIARIHIEFLTALLRLRQACCHPALANPRGNWRDADSVKLSYLKEQLPELLHAGHRILVFSQFTSMLDLISSSLKKLKVNHLMLTGKSKHRDNIIESFRRGDASVFLISLKAGGVGLNLTEADTVFLCDPWWNPAVESQAIDRAYRIGQKKRVTVFRLFTVDTIEEKIEKLQEAKRVLFERTLSGAGGGLAKKFSREDIEFLLTG